MLLFKSTSQEGLTVAARDSALLYFVGSKLSPLITYTAGETNYLKVFNLPQLTLLTVFWTIGSVFAKLPHDYLSGDDIRRRC
jgi:hypothetical protein